MTAANWLNAALIFQYVLLAFLFAVLGHWPKFFYWIAAGILTASLLWMK